MFIFFFFGTKTATTSQQKPTTPKACVKNPLLTKTVSGLLSHNQSIIQRQKELRSRFYQFQIERGGLLPKVNVSASHKYNYNRDPAIEKNNPAEPSINQNLGSGVNTTLTQPLFAGGTLFGALKKADLEIQADIYQYYADLTRIIVEIIGVVTTIQQQEEDIATYQYNRSLREKMLAEATARVQEGQAEESDMYNAQASLSNVMQQLAQAEATLADNKFQYKELTGLEYQSSAWIDVPTQLNIDDLLKKVEKGNFEVQSRQKRSEVAARQKKIALGEFSPKVNLSGSMGYNFITNPENKRYNDPAFRKSPSAERATFNTSVGVDGQWNVFNGLADKGKVQQAAEAYRAAISALYATVQKTRNEFSRSKSEYMSAQQSEPLLVRTVSGYQRSFDLYFEQYREGKRSFQDLSEVSNSLVNASVNLSRNRRALRLSAYSMLQLAGMLLPEYFGVNEEFQAQTLYKQHKKKL